jgi:hypothetical protein
VEAVCLARLLARLMPDAAEAHGLLALLALTDARRPARVDAGGALVSLESQDRSRWDAACVDEGVATLERALRLDGRGPYVIQAAIAALHSQAPRWEQTDWPQISGLYAELARHDPSPVVAINRGDRGRLRRGTGGRPGARRRRAPGPLPAAGRRAPSCWLAAATRMRTRGRSRCRRTPPSERRSCGGGRARRIGERLTPRVAEPARR